MSTRTPSPDRDELLRGTLDLLILRTITAQPQHGQGIARAIQSRSANALIVDHGSLYPALQRIEERGWARAKWGISENNRRARFYSITAAGRAQLVTEVGRWTRLVDAIALILAPDPLPE